MHRQVRKKIQIAKEEWIEIQCSAIKKGMETGDSKNAYSTLKSLTKSSQLRTAVINYQDGKLITDREKVLKRWTEYCKGLYNYEIHPDISSLQTDLPSTDGEDSLPILKEEVEAAVQSLKLGKSPGVDNIPYELVIYGGKEVVKPLTTICQQILEQKKWPKELTQSLMIPLPKKGNLRQYENHKMISLISHPSKDMLCIILNHLKSKAEELLPEEQAGFRARWSTVEQTFNCRVLIEKHLQHQRDLFHNFIDFKKAFDWVWHNGLWHVLRGCNIEKGLIEVIQTLSDHATSAVLLNNHLGEFLQMTIGIRQGCILSPALFNLFLDRIMQETLHNHTTKISISGRPICNLCFADNINFMAGSNSELQELTNKLVATASAYGIEITTVKSKIMVNSTNNTSVSINMDGKKLEEVSSFKYLGATLTKDSTCKTEIHTWIATATAVMARLTMV